MVLQLHHVIIFNYHVIREDKITFGIWPMVIGNKSWTNTSYALFPHPWYNEIKTDKTYRFRCYVYVPLSPLPVNWSAVPRMNCLCTLTSDLGGIPSVDLCHLPVFICWTCQSSRYHIAWVLYPLIMNIPSSKGYSDNIVWNVPRWSKAI